MLSESLNIETNEGQLMSARIMKAWKNIAPWWPLKNLIATNPLQGFECQPYEKANILAASYFQKKSIPSEMEEVNRITIKWCQALLDEEQATISVPGKQRGLYPAWRALILLDKQLYKKDKHFIAFLKSLPLDAEDAIAACLKKLHIKNTDTTLFLTLLLTTLPGWASHIKYQNKWKQPCTDNEISLSEIEYLSMRLIITCALYQDAHMLLNWHLQPEFSFVDSIKRTTIQREENYKNQLLAKLQHVNKKIKSEVQSPDAQLVFCIDIRGEAIRRTLEEEGNYETFGFAGFFGIPAIIHNTESGEKYASCPVLISPKHIINQVPCNNTALTKIHQYINTCKQIYQGLKYTLTTPLILAEILGPWSGLLMAIKTFLPVGFNNIKTRIDKKNELTNSLRYEIQADSHQCGISFDDQYSYAKSALRMIGLTTHFSKVIILCGHRGQTENNAYASALDCGACGGHEGSANAKILAEILNNPAVRQRLMNDGIAIPTDTRFIAALHNTTTDTVHIFDAGENQHADIIAKLKSALKNAAYKNNQQHTNKAFKRSVDWAQTRPEWGLARNASFIIGPRSLTKNLNLDKRSFLHSYDWQQDENGSLLTNILTAPLVVAQWINCQYLYSTIDNVAYGSGSKITHNVVGKIGIMQGNASDLMTGLPLQSIKRTDQEDYHEPLRLLAVIYAPMHIINRSIESQSILQTLFGNCWIVVICIDPTDGMSYELQRNLSWKLANFEDNR